MALKTNIAAQIMEPRQKILDKVIAYKLGLKESVIIASESFLNNKILTNKGSITGLCFF
jgi:hypothetical protein